MSAGLWIVLGIVLIVAGVYSFMNRDGVWAGQVRANEARGLASERTGAWEMNQSLRGGMAIILGIVALVAGLINVAAPQPPAGTYNCVEGSLMDDDRNTLTLQGDGTGTYNTQTFDWTYNKAELTVSFTGDTELVTGRFLTQDNDMKTLTLLLKSGDGVGCFRR